MTTDDLLKQGFAALKAGRNEEARNLLMQVVEQDERSEKAWLWLSGAVDSDEERITCLEKVLAINPDNKIARQGIEALRRQSAPGLDSTPDTGPPKDKPATSPVVDTRECIKPVPRAKGRETNPESTERHGSTASDSRKMSSTKKTSAARKRVDTTPRRARRWSAANWIMLFLILVLVGTQVWMFDRISKLEKTLAETQAKTVALTNRIITLASELDRVAALAENANRYAHSHW